MVAIATEHEVEKYVQMLMELPQANVIDQDRMRPWVERVLSFEPERILWHIKRLSGIGGSEIGVSAAPFADYYHPFNQPRDTFFDKTLITLPEPPNGHMRRGTFMEDTIRDIFRSKYQMVANDKAIESIGSFRDPKHPWRVGNPDDYGLIGKRHWMVDYKCPTPGFAEDYDKFGISFDYICQLHHYTAMARARGIPVDGLLLCSFDTSKWDIDVRFIELDNHTFKIIEEAGDWMWNDCILRGEMPKTHYQPPMRIEGSEPTEVRLRNLMERLAVIGTLANQAYSQTDDIKEEINDLLRERPLGDKKLAHELVNVTAKPEFDTERALILLQKFSLDPNDFQRDGKLKVDELLTAAQEKQMDVSKFYEKELDVELIHNTLIDKGLVADQFTKESMTIRISGKKGSPLGEKLEDLRANARTDIERFEKRFIGAQKTPQQELEEVESQGVRRSRGPGM